MIVVRFATFLIVSSIALGSSFAQTSVTEGPRVSVVTVQPGDPVYTLFGHTAVRVVDPERDIDYSFNYGTFDYGDPLFLPKFVQGNLNYFLSIAPFPASLQNYATIENRTVIEQHLDLTSSEVHQLISALSENARPENREYRYDFLYDNCSTRVLDILESVVAINLKSGSENFTFRDRLNPYMRKRPLVKTGIDLSLGLDVDNVIDGRQASFLPDDLMELLAGATIDDPNVAAGISDRLLISKTDTLYVSKAKSKPIPWITLVGWLLVGVQAFGIFRGYQNKRSSNIFDVFFLSVAGLLGILILYMWLFTHHTVTALNANLLWAFPGHLLIAFLFVRSKISLKFLQRYAAIAIVFFVAFVALGATRVYVSWLMVPWAILTIESAVRLFLTKKRTAHTQLSNDS